MMKPQLRCVLKWGVPKNDEFPSREICKFDDQLGSPNFGNLRSPLWNPNLRIIMYKKPCNIMQLYETSINLHFELITSHHWTSMFSSFPGDFFPTTSNDHASLTRLPKDQHPILAAACVNQGFRLLGGWEWEIPELNRSYRWMYHLLFLVGGLEHVLFFYILGIIQLIPTD